MSLTFELQKGSTVPGHHHQLRQCRWFVTGLQWSTTLTARSTDQNQPGEAGRLLANKLGCTLGRQVLAKRLDYPWRHLRREWAQQGP